QAIARVNRPYEDEEGRKKPCGFVLDFVGIFDKLEKALSFDSVDIAGVIQDIAALKHAFAEKMQQARDNYLSLIKGLTADKAVEKVLEFFIEESKRQDYYLFFRELQDLYEILSPDAFLREYLDDFETLARMYRILREAYETKIPLNRDFARKTATLIADHTKVGVIKPALEIYEINENTLSLIEKSRVSDTEKIFNIIKSIEYVLNSKGKTSPYLISIAEKAEVILKMYKERQKTTEETLEELKKLIVEIHSAQEEQGKKGMSPEVFTVYWILKQKSIPKPEELANEIKTVFARYPYWKTSETQEKEVRQEFYALIMKEGFKNLEMLSQIIEDMIKKLKGIS
ncbi:MAG: type I restriction endonuclease subunit R, partial [bacterium]|nr:type I restriction endonuclease subunit R [bacterium]